MVIFFNDTATAEIYTLSLHDALPICKRTIPGKGAGTGGSNAEMNDIGASTVDTHGNRNFSAINIDANVIGCETTTDRKSTRLNSSHANISYAVFCLKKKNSILHACHL